MSKICDLCKKLDKAEKESNKLSLHSHDMFMGDYLTWPTFRDMFTAVYILNKRVTPVVKLNHLR